MPPCFCNKCYRVVEDGTRHFCSFYENDETVYNLPQKEETAEVDINCDETNGKNAEIFNHSNGNMCETVQEIGTASQASTSPLENKELYGGSFGKLTDSAHRPFAQGPSLQSPDNMEILDAGAHQPLGLNKAAAALLGPSTIRHQTFGTDGRRLYVCEECSYQCKYKSDFDRHYKKHTGEKNQVCSTCGKSFSRKGNLKRHERTHTGEKPFKCNICERDFGQKSILEAHLKKHTGEWPFQCEKCGKGFSRRGHLDMHFRTHMGERPFECPIFNRRFSNPSNLRSHVANPCRGPYRCGRCEQTFSSNEDRNRHFMQEHGQRE